MKDSVAYKILPRGILVITLETTEFSQVQLIIIPANTKVPEHRHPRCSKIVRPIYGSAICQRGENKKLVKPKNYKDYILDANVLHSVETFNEPFCYLSIQEWEGLPCSIEQDWVGETL